MADAKYEGASDVRFNTRMAQTWLEKVDAKSIKRTWADVIDAKCKLVKGGTKERWERVKKALTASMRAWVPERRAIDFVHSNPFAR